MTVYRAILASLTTGTKTVTELAQPFDMTMPAVTKHLKVLERARLIERTRHAQYRPCTLQPQPLRELDRWLEQYRQFFEGSFERLADDRMQHGLPRGRRLALLHARPK